MPELPVARRNFRGTHWPLNCYGGIVEGHPSLGFRSVWGSMEIQQFAIGFEDLKPMGKPLRNYEHAIFVRNKLSSAPFQIIGAGLSEIYGNIKNPPAQATNKFSLRMGWPLEMQTSNRTDHFCDGAIDLMKRCASEQRRKGFGAVQSDEFAAMVTERAALYQLDVGKGCVNDDHAHLGDVAADAGSGRNMGNAELVQGVVGC